MTLVNFKYCLVCILLTLSISTQLFAAPNSKQAPWVGDTLTGKPCVGGGQGFGPFDYLKRHTLTNEYSLVIDAHFTSDVQNLIRGSSGHNALPDLDYTLRAWPNHHKALQSISRYQLLHKSSQDKRYARKPSPSVECYFQRAINFSPRDAISHMLYAIFLHQSGFANKAAAQYKKAITISPNNRSIHYNYGLLLVSMKRYEEAEAHAKKAYAAGYPLSGLKKKLIKIGHWNEETTNKTADPNSSK